MQKFDFDNAMYSFGCIASFCRIYCMRHFAVWVCGFVNCVKYFDKTRLVCKIVCKQLEKNCICL